MTSICCLSGKKQSGKNTAANYIAAKYLMKTNQISDFQITDSGLLKCRIKLNGQSSWIIIDEGDFNSFDFEGIKHYSFADPLKRFCMDVFGLTYEQCYGTDEDKNSKTRLRWSDMPGWVGRDDFMTARELLQHFGTNVVRSMFNDAWVSATISKIRREKTRLAIISDARFPNEIMGIMNVGGVTVRLLRSISNTDEHYSETALDNFPSLDYSVVIDNRSHTIKEQCKALDPVIDSLFEQMVGGK